MKIGDLVKMDFTKHENNSDLWGIGIVIDIEDRQATFGGTDVVVMWSKAGVSWEMPEMLDEVDENR